MTKTKSRNPKSLFDLIFPCCRDESSDEEDDGEDEEDDKFIDLDFDREEIQKYRVNENFFDQFVISQDSAFIGAWNTFIIMLKVCTGLWYLSMACFWQSQKEYIKDNPGSDPNHVADMCSIGIEVCFFIDMILCCFKAYISETDNKVVTTSGDIF